MSFKLQRRSFGLLTSLAALAFALPGISLADDIKKGGRLVYLEQQPNTVLYPPAAGFYPNGGIVNQLTDKLTYQNPETLEIEPWIAVSWEINEDATEYTFKLREGVTFSDGTPLDAAAVALNYDIYGLGAADRNYPVSEVINNYERSEVLDPLTVRFHFKAPSPGFLQGTSVIGSGLVSPATLARGFAELGDATLIVGSGPFVATSHKIGTEVVFEARDDYNWGPVNHPHQGRANIDELRLIIVPEDGVRIGALLAGQGDVVRQIQAYDEGQITDRNFQLLSGQTRGINNGLAIRPDNPLVADLRVRQALLHATNRDEILSTIYSDTYPAARSPLSSFAAGFVDLSDKITFDAAKAAALLDEAGWVLNSDGKREKDGTLLALATYESPPQPQNRAMLQLIAQQWARLGITLDVKAGDSGSRDLDNLDPLKTPVATAMVGRADPDVIKSNFHPLNRNMLLQKGGISDKVQSFEDGDLNALLEAISAETDAEKRLALVADVQNYLIDQAYFIPVFEEPQVYGAAPYVKDLRFEAVGRPSFYSVWLDK